MQVTLMSVYEPGPHGPLSHEELERHVAERVVARVPRFRQRLKELPLHADFPYWVDAPKPFQPGDENAFWFLDFHWSRGLTPLAATLWSADGYCWGTQSASEKLPLPPGRGITCRFAGTHLYGSPIPETFPWPGS